MGMREIACILHNIRNPQTPSLGRYPLAKRLSEMQIPALSKYTAGAIQQMIQRLLDATICTYHASAVVYLGTFRGLRDMSIDAANLDKFLRQDAHKDGIALASLVSVYKREFRRDLRVLGDPKLQDILSLGPLSDVCALIERSSDKSPSSPSNVKSPTSNLSTATINSLSNNNDGNDAAVTVSPPKRKAVFVVHRSRLEDVFANYPDACNLQTPSNWAAINSDRDLFNASIDQFLSHIDAPTPIDFAPTNPFHILQSTGSPGSKYAAISQMQAYHSSNSPMAATVNNMRHHSPSLSVQTTHHKRQMSSRAAPLSMSSSFAPSRPPTSLSARLNRPPPSTVHSRQGSNHMLPNNPQITPAHGVGAKASSGFNPRGPFVPHRTISEGLVLLSSSIHNSKNENTFSPVSNNFHHHQKLSHHHSSMTSNSVDQNSSIFNSQRPNSYQNNVSNIKSGHVPSVSTHFTNNNNSNGVSPPLNISIQQQSSNYHHNLHSLQSTSGHISSLSSPNIISHNDNNPLDLSSHQLQQTHNNSHQHNSSPHLHLSIHQPPPPIMHSIITPPPFDVRLFPPTPDICSSSSYPLHPATNEFHFSHQPRALSIHQPMASQSAVHHYPPTLCSREPSPVPHYSSPFKGAVVIAPETSPPTHFRAPSASYSPQDALLATRGDLANSNNHVRNASQRILHLQTGSGIPLASAAAFSSTIGNESGHQLHHHHMKPRVSEGDNNLLAEIFSSTNNSINNINSGINQQQQPPPPQQPQLVRVNSSRSIHSNHNPSSSIITTADEATSPFSPIKQSSSVVSPLNVHVSSPDSFPLVSTFDEHQNNSSNLFTQQHPQIMTNWPNASAGGGGGASKASMYGLQGHLPYNSWEPDHARFTFSTNHHNNNNSGILLNANNTSDPIINISTPSSPIDLRNGRGELHFLSSHSPAHPLHMSAGGGGSNLLHSHPSTPQMLIHNHNIETSNNNNSSSIMVSSSLHQSQQILHGEGHLLSNNHAATSNFPPTAPHTLFAEETQEMPFGGVLGQTGDYMGSY